MPVAYLVIPIFALANTGISLEFGSLGDTLTHPVMLGVSLGLVLGKFIGITGVCWPMLKLGVAVLPKDTRYTQIAGVSLLAGIGFTMSIFVAQLGFGESEDILRMAKTGILAASLLARLQAFSVMRRCCSRLLFGCPALYAGNRKPEYVKAWNGKSAAHMIEIYEHMT